MSHDKSRFAFRGKKLRYSVFRAKVNTHWERVYEEMTRNICALHGLDIEEEMVEHHRRPWMKTWEKLIGSRYWMSRSICAIQTEVDCGLDSESHLALQSMAQRAGGSECET
jgi:hypothetical protein